MIDSLADQLGSDLVQVDALTICEAAPPNTSPPREFTLELTTQRPVDGQLTPQHHVDLNRAPISFDDACQIIEQVAQYDDAVLTLGGLGDALEHPQWREIVAAAHGAGVFGLCIETDLHVEQKDLDSLLDLPIDVISIRLNADTAATYEKLMTDKPGRFKEVMDNVQYLLQQRAQRNLFSVPWIVPRLIKTADTLKDMETFFERWLTYTGWAIIEPAPAGCGLMPDYAPVNMAPPKRLPCRQLHRRMTIHADGQVPRCDQDWLAKESIGNAIKTNINELWQNQNPLRSAHQQGSFSDLELCSGCTQWHRPYATLPSTTATSPFALPT
jgi:radical SAM protein with 4Fe4S-binding SPASM domain